MNRERVERVAKLARAAGSVGDCWHDKRLQLLADLADALLEEDDEQPPPSSAATRCGAV